MTAREIAAALGSARRSGEWWRCVCPVHGSRTGHSLTLALRDDDRGLIVHCHADCRTRDVLAELCRIGLLTGRSDGMSAAPTVRGDSRGDSARRIALARSTWNRAQDARGSPVGRYLAAYGITPHRRHCAGRHPSGTLPVPVQSRLSAPIALQQRGRCSMRAAVIAVAINNARPEGKR